MLNEDYKDILQSLSRNKVKYLLIGAYAMGIYGYPRATGDFDIWVEASEDNSKKVLRALQEFGCPLKGINEKTFSEEGIVFQIGIAPRRIDIITGIDGVKFAGAYKNRKIVKVERLNLPFISMQDLIKNKKATGRDKDILDIKYLKIKHRNKGESS